MSLRCIIGVVLLGVASVASAAEEMPPADRDDIEALGVFSSCIVDRYRSEAEELLKGDFREEAYAEEMRRFATRHPRCLGPRGGKLRMAGVLFAGAVAEALLHEDMTADQLAAVLRPPEPALEARSPGEYTAMCMALAYPAETSALLFSDAASSAGDAALVAYARELPGCVQPGQELRINKPGLRAIVALAAYRIAATDRASGES